MEFPKNAATAATERIMRLFSSFSEHEKDHIVSLQTGVYNRLYSLLYSEFQAIEGAKAVVASSPRKVFPIQNVGLIPWSLAERAYKDYSGRHGKTQSLQRMAERGGFGLAELGDYLAPERRLLQRGTAQALNECCEIATREILKASRLPDAERLDAAVTVLEALLHAGYYVHDASGQRLTREEFLVAVTTALDATIAQNIERNGSTPPAGHNPDGR